MTNTLPVHVRATRVTRKRRSLLFGRTYFTFGFYHHRGPDPELTWTSGEDVLDLRFG
jgi:hypothetical protein